MRDCDPTFMFLVENSADLICRFGRDRRATYISPSCLPLLGWTAEEMMNFAPPDYIHHDDLQILAEASKSAPQFGNRVSSPVVRVRRKDGTWTVSYTHLRAHETRH